MSLLEFQVLVVTTKIKKCEQANIWSISITRTVTIYENLITGIKLKIEPENPFKLSWQKFCTTNLLHFLKTC